MAETDWKLLAVQRGIDLNILETAMIEIEEYRPSRGSEEPYMDIAGFVMKRARLALEELRQSRMPSDVKGPSHP
jgi:hypothetical protein